jgi:hypothetical protein
MRKLILVMLVWQLLSPAGTVVAENRALLIGVGEYKHSNKFLPGIDKDIQMMYEITKEMGFLEHQVKLLIDVQASRADIESAIMTWLIDGVSSQDRILFYFSGHGCRIPDENNDEGDGVDEGLAPYDIQVKADESLSNVFLDDRFGELLAQVPANEVFVIIDACHSGTATKAGSFTTDRGVERSTGYPKVWFSGKISRGKGDVFAFEEKSDDLQYAALSACDDEEIAVATPTGSLFTRSLYRAVTGDTEEKLTMAGLQQAAAAFIRKNIPPTKKVYSPQLTGNRELRAKRIYIRPVSVSLWTRLESLVDRAPHSISITTNKSVFSVGDKTLEITCTVPEDGYLNILNLAHGFENPIVLYPNQYHPDNRVNKDERITIPQKGDNFRLKADPPRGEWLIAAFFSREAISAYQQGYGKLDTIFRRATEKTLKTITDNQTNVRFSPVPVGSTPQTTPVSVAEMGIPAAAGKVIIRVE